ncbi:MAG TPA: hypothetical protein VMK12_24115, partial [Anaeromyxobacteraceae bacterium]|nr:hypothetical protein [Anaeromyxobacteraceae bacterium]
HARHFGGETVRVENPRHLKNALWSEPLARNRVKARQRVAALHEKIANRRQLLAQEEFSR